MTTSLDTIRYHSGIAGEEVADNAEWFLPENNYQLLELPE